MMVCCPACDQALPIRWLLFRSNMICPHCQARLEGSWLRWTMIQLVGLLFTLQVTSKPLGDWYAVCYQLGLLLFLLWTLSIFMPGQYCVKPPQLEKEETP